jgi:hypothetical protein
MAEKLSWDEIKRRYPDEWVALVEDDWPDTMPDPLSGDRPLDPCPDPWFKARRVSLTALWQPEDLAKLIEFAMTTAHVHVTISRRQGLVAPLDAHKALSRLREPWLEVFLSILPVNIPPGARDCWKSLPVVHISSPLTMGYRTGIGHLYYIEFARKVIDSAALVQQPKAFLKFADRLHAWLATMFTNQRGRNTVDNPAEYERLRGGW